MKYSKRMQRLFSMLLAVVMVVSVLLIGMLSVFAETAEFAGGSGTEADPYLISDKAHLNNVRNYLGSHFKLIADIEFTDSDFQEGGAFYNNGAGFEPIGTKNVPFVGVFDGNGHVIKNLYINIENETDVIVYVGLFGYIEGTIKNFGMVDNTISTTTDNGIGYVGGIVGYNRGTITNCYNTGIVSASSNYSNSEDVGGIAGCNFGTITNCHNTGSVTVANGDLNYAGGIAGSSFGTIINCYNTGSVTIANGYSSRAGGIAGHTGGTINSCYNSGSISAASNPDSFIDAASNACVGGIAGFSTRTITNCYNFGNASATVFQKEQDAYAGGIAGYNWETIENCYSIGTASASSNHSNGYIGGIEGLCCDGIITNCYYYDIALKGVGNGTDTATKCTIDELKQQATFVGFDFESVWTFDETLDDYPFPVLKNVKHCGAFSTPAQPQPDKSEDTPTDNSTEPEQDSSIGNSTEPEQDGLNDNSIESSTNISNGSVTESSKETTSLELETSDGGTENSTSPNSTNGNRIWLIVTAVIVLIAGLAGGLLSKLVFNKK